jgi:hypothetical protein
MAELADVRLAIFDALNATGAGVNVYRRRKLDPQMPAFVVGWPQSMDVRAAQGAGIRDYVIDVNIGVQVVDDEGADEELEELIEVAVAAVLLDPSWDVQPVTDFGEEILADGRVTMWCRLPVAVHS